ncbi:glycosyltransferase family 2 protein, partial [Mycobacterium timonense]
MTAPMFSIIVPTFNAAATLQMCIESIICQTYSDLELVLVDGGSTAATLDVAQGFAGKLGARRVV